jgi:hypothetical protein
MNDIAVYSTTEKFELRRELLLASWLRRDLPLRDYLLGNVVCSTSRWLIFGDTGIGKTLFAFVHGRGDGVRRLISRMGRKAPRARHVSRRRNAR